MIKLIRSLTLESKVIENILRMCLEKLNKLIMLKFIIPNYKIILKF